MSSQSDGIDQDTERRATWLELFFDLVFVAAVAALAHVLHDPVAGLGAFALLFVPVWWAWMGFTWYAASFDDDGPVHRVGMLAAMLLTAVLAATVHGVVEQHSTTFVIAYAALMALLAGLHAAAARRDRDNRALATRLAAGNAVGAVLWLASLLLPEPWRPLLWAVAMIVLIGSFAAGRWARVVTSRSPYDPAHVAERYGLFTLVVLGESVVVTAGAIDVGGDAGAAATAALGFVIAAAVWWLYFGLFRAMPVAVGPGARFVWAQGHLLVFAGITAAAVGIEFAIETGVHHDLLTLADRLPLAAGLAAYLLAMALIRVTTRGPDRSAGVRAAGGLVVLALGVTGTGPLPLVFVAVLAAATVAVVLGDHAVRRHAVAA